MIYLRAFLLFSLVVIHVVGGAALFRRYFPKESPWLGFLIPGFAVAMLCNFIEHGVALTGLHWLMILTTIGAIAALVCTPRVRWRYLWKPTLIFVVAFLIPFVLHCYKPDIAPRRDSAIDLQFVASFCMGDTLPPDSGWLPGFTNKLYYNFTHYSASVLARLLGVDPGTGINVAGSLLSGLILFCSGAIAYGVSKQRLWVALLVTLMTATAMDGDTAWLWLFSKDLKEPDDMTIFFNHAGDNCPTPFDWLMKCPPDWYCMRELIPLGYWGWSGAYHSVAGGQLLIVFSIFCMVEMFNRPGTNWPWIGTVWAILLMVVCSTWGVPMMSLLFLASAGWCVWRGIYPGSWRMVILMTMVGVTAMTPDLLDFLQVVTPPGAAPNAEEHTPLVEFLFQWWPVFIPWVLLFFWWKQLHPVVRIIQIVTPVMYFVVEYHNIGCRMDMTGKCWGYVYGAAWVAFIPAMLSLRSWTLRGVSLAFVVMCGLSTCFWVDYYQRSIDWDNVAQLTGQGTMRSDPVKARIWNKVATVKHKIMIQGIDTWCYADNPMLANLNYNKTYIAWCSHCAGALHPNSFDVAPTRDDEVNTMYKGLMPDPLGFLRKNDISMVTIWPDDNIKPEIVEKLKQQLGPDYTYVDCRNPSADPSENQAGIFMYRGMTVDGQVAQR